MSWERKIVKIGNSLGLRLPNQIFQKTNFREDAAVSVQIEDESTLKIELEED